ncbi:hypothetical protein MKK75_21850 [Methylobacterium sp. J-030]|uniref:hypothetical protein n=1 Tax=Methylobacterium sp. J-030 TaxID=2836627 RepID=UPI001FBBD6C3|nr:hypothetical protein [Methylobacterium sp. J-030]MCJ2071407.1 hypothetical protein [Methylobacterium sp. J-030]
MGQIDTSDLPPVLSKLLAPWLEAIETSEIGMGDHVTAIAAHSFMSLLHRIEMTPMLERSLVDARAATDTLAAVLDYKRAVPLRVRRAARHAIAAVIEALRDATPNAVTKELGLGW